MNELLENFKTAKYVDGCFYSNTNSIWSSLDLQNDLNGPLDSCLDNVIIVKRSV